MQTPPTQRLEKKRVWTFDNKEKRNKTTMPTIQTVLCIGNVFVQFLKQNFNHIYFYRKTLKFYSQVTLYPQNVFTFSCLVFTCVSGSRFPSADFVNLRVASVFFWPSAPAQGFTPFPALPAWVEGRLGCFLNASETGGLTWYPEVHKDIVHIKTDLMLMR